MSPAQRISKRGQLFCGRPWVECHYCGARLDRSSATLDHIIPRAAGGTNHLSNLLLSCAGCNRKKGAKKYRNFIKKNGLRAA